VEASGEQYGLVLRMGTLPIYPRDERRRLQVAVSGEEWESRRVLVADETAHQLLFSQTLDRELADWLTELLEQEPESLSVDASTARSLLAVSEKLSRLVQVEIPEQLAGPRVPLDSLALLLALVASGSFGLGRFSWVGIDALVFAGVIFVQVLIPTLLAALVVVRPYTSADERK
jgi:hypothetical protein